MRASFGRSTPRRSSRARSSLEQLHREPGHSRTRVHAGADHLHDVIARHARADPRLLHEPLPQRRVGHELRVHHLERARVPRADLLDDVDGAHTAFGEPAHDAEVTGEGRSGGEIGGERHGRSRSTSAAPRALGALLHAGNVSAPMSSKDSQTPMDAVNTTSEQRLRTSILPGARCAWSGGGSRTKMRRGRERGLIVRANERERE